MRYPFRKITVAAVFAAFFALLLLTAAAPPQASAAATSAVFGRERLFTLSAADTAALKTSYSTVILFVVDVAANGDLNYNGNHLIVQNGKYVGDPGWGARLANLKAPPTTVTRIEVCTGGAGAQSFVNIRNLIASQGTGPTSVLYKNFQVMKNTLGIDAIDYDDEVDYDAGSAVSFGQLVATLGMHVTLCPYNNERYWQTVKSQLGSKVDAVYLQCYDGGFGNDPGYWNTLFGGLKVFPGDWDVNDVPTFQANMAGWASANGVTGGFFWLFDDRDPATSSQYAAAINTGIDGTNLIASGDSGEATLSWTPRAGAVTYKIYRGTNRDGEGAVPVAANIAATRYVDTGLTNGVTYYYKITGVNSGGESVPSNETFATPRALQAGEVLPTSEAGGHLWQYVFNTPAASWYATSYDDSFWLGGLAGFGTIYGGGGTTRTPWTATPGDIWIRRHFTISGSVPTNARFRAFYDESCEVYINGVPAGSATGYVTRYVSLPMTGAGQSALHIGDNVIAIHCTQTGGGQFLDIGIQSDPVPAPSAPTSLSAGANGGQISLTWTGSPGAARYNLYRAVTPGGEGTVPFQTGITATTTIDTGPVGGTPYYYKVTAVNAGGESAPSNEASAKVALPTISGIVSLQQVAAGNFGQPITFTLTPTGTTAGSVTTQTVTLAAADGAYTLTNIPPGTYTLSVKGSKWLRKNVPVDTTAGSVTGLTIPLRGGDINGDNQVSLSDFIVLRTAYGSSPTSAKWNPNADINCDGQVSLTDFIILRSNYRRSGDK